MKEPRTLAPLGSSSVALILLLAVGMLPATTYDRQAVVDHANEHWNNADPAGRDPRFMYYPCQSCAEFGSQCQYEIG